MHKQKIIGHIDTVKCDLQNRRTSQTLNASLTLAMRGIKTHARLATSYLIYVWNAKAIQLKLYDILILKNSLTDGQTTDSDEPYVT